MLTEAFESLRKNLEPSKSLDEATQTHHKAVRSVIENNGNEPDTKLIGSLQRCTRISPRKNDIFDIDILVVLGSFGRWSADGITPRAALSTVHQIVSESERYEALSPQADAPTIQFYYKDGIKVELVPAYRNEVGTFPDGTTCLPKSRGYWIPSESGFWKHADYDYEADMISEMNKLTGGLFIPTLKMLKAIRRVYFPIITPFHLEVLAYNVFPANYLELKRQGFPINYPTLITHFFCSALGSLAIPQRINGSNSPLLNLSSSELPRVVEAFSTISEFCIDILKNKSEIKQLSDWKKLFGEFFPAVESSQWIAPNI